MSQKRSFDAISVECSGDNPSKRTRVVANRYGRRESACNYNSFFDQAVDEHEEHSQSGTKFIGLFQAPRNTSPDGSSVTSQNSNNKQQFVDQNLDKLIVATISSLTKQIIDINKKLQIFESHMVKQSREPDFENVDSKDIQNFSLPIERPENLIELESKLKSRSFKILTVNTSRFFYSSIDLLKKCLVLQISRLKKIYENSQIRNLKHPLSTIVNALIVPKVLSQYTWTGKSNKLQFKSFSEVHDVLFRTMREINSNYTWQKFKQELVYNVLKYAYKYAEPIVSNSNVSVMNTTFVYESIPII